LADSKKSVVYCPTCYSSNLQFSRVRPEERIRLLLLEHPVRCRKCNNRFPAPLAYALKLQKAEKAKLKEQPPVKTH
jgi:hypothetical protein